MKVKLKKQIHEMITSEMKSYLRENCSPKTPKTNPIS